MSYKLTLSMVDYYGRTTTRSFQVDAVDFAAAQAVVAAFVPDYEAVTELWVQKSRLVDEVTYTGTVLENANKDEGMTLSVELATPGKKASIQVPGPDRSIRNLDGTIDLTETIMVDFMAHFTGGSILVSDGEVVDAFLKGTLDV